MAPWTIARQATLSVGFPRQECGNGLPSPSPGNLPDPGVKPVSPALVGGFLTTESLDDVMRPLERLMFAFSYIILPFLSYAYPCSPEFSHFLAKTRWQVFSCLFLVIFGFPSPAEGVAESECRVTGCSEPHQSCVQ